MRSRSKIEVRRCRPLLGTFVDVACYGSADDVDDALRSIQKVHRLMSFHEPVSDVTRINHHASDEAIEVHPWTWRVLNLAQQFSRNSGGVFDITVAVQLVEWNYLPKPCTRFGKGTWRDIILQSRNRVRFRRRVLIDLGGIAKGFAVDRAVEVLKRKGASAGIVNAGGDLRVFGSHSHIVHLRHPTRPNHASGAVTVRERAIATSGIYFGVRNNGRCPGSPLLNARTGHAERDLISVTVGAPNCVTADALTKVVFALRERAAPLLQRYAADALVIEKDGAPSWMFHPTCDASLQT